MARTGLRMMPTFPSPSLKCRTSGFPQYGFKASLSGRACPTDITVKPAPGMPAPSTSLPRPFARFRAGGATWHCVQITPRLHGPLCERPLPLYPRGPWLRSGLCCPRPSSLTTTPSAGLAGTRGFHGLPLIPRAFAVRERLGDPRDLPYCPWRAVHTCRRPYAGGSAAPSRCVGTAIPGFLVLPPSRHPHGPSLPAIPDELMLFGAASFALGCGPQVCPALQTGYDERGATWAPTPPSEAPCHPRFLRRPSPAATGSQARGANGKSPLVGTCTRPVRSR